MSRDLLSRDPLSSPDRPSSLLYVSLFLLYKVAADFFSSLLNGVRSSSEISFVSQQSLILSTVDCDFGSDGYSDKILFSNILARQTLILFWFAPSFSLWCFSNFDWKPYQSDSVRCSIKSLFSIGNIFWDHLCFEFMKKSENFIDFRIHVLQFRKIYNNLICGRLDKIVFYFALHWSLRICF